jgi:flagellar motility protein MotE (MotC chaperone)
MSAVIGSAPSNETQDEMRARLQADAMALNGLVREGGRVKLAKKPPVSNGLRVLPVVVIALVGLLSFKMIGLVSEGGYTFPFGRDGNQHPFANFGQAIANWKGNPYIDPLVTGAIPGEEKKEEPAKSTEADDKAKMAQAAPDTAGKPEETKPEEAKPGDAKPADGEVAAKPDKPNAMPDNALAGSPAMPTQVPAGLPSESERALMMRLQQRRETLEKRSQEIDIREGLLEAAEKRLEDRIIDLQKAEAGTEMEGESSIAPAPDTKAAPGAPAAATASKKHDPKQTIRNLVTVYETMRPKEAARVFETLDEVVLIEVVRQIAPRKMAEIMAAMDPAAAAKLTVALAKDSGARAKRAPVADSSLPAGELPRLPAKTAPPAASAPAP